MTESMKQVLGQLAARGNLRQLPRFDREGRYAVTGGRRMLNLSSNDYLGMAGDPELRKAFLDTLSPETFLPTASSSRLLTGNYPVCEELEETLAHLFGTEAALVFNSGYHANTGILPAVADAHTLILADKLVHASLIDGIRLSTAHCIRYRHNDLAQLERLLARHAGDYRRIIVVTESIFSMDGDETDLPELVRLKRCYGDKVWLYVDEAHAFGLRGPQGLGCAEACGCTADIDFLVGTFGKALASVGAFVACRQTVRDFLVNRMRTFIFTTALPPVNIAWTLFVLRRLPGMGQARAHLAAISARLREGLRSQGFPCPSTSHIVPLVVGASEDAVRCANELQQCGFYALPVRPPTVPEGTSRIRFSLTASVTQAETDELVSTTAAIIHAL